MIKSALAMRSASITVSISQPITTLVSHSSAYVGTNVIDCRNQAFSGKDHGVSGKDHGAKSSNNGVECINIVHSLAQPVEGTRQTWFSQVVPIGVLSERLR